MDRPTILRVKRKADEAALSAVVLEQVVPKSAVSGVGGLSALVEDFAVSEQQPEQRKEIVVKRVFSLAASVPSHIVRTKDGAEAIQDRIDEARRRRGVVLGKISVSSGEVLDSSLNEAAKAQKASSKIARLEQVRLQRGKVAREDMLSQHFRVVDYESESVKRVKMATDGDEAEAGTAEEGEADVVYDFFYMNDSKHAQAADEMMT